MDFFICYNEADKAWADWVSWQLEEAKYKVWNPDWDILPGQNEAIAIQKALFDANAQQAERRMILILSPNFASKSMQEASWTSIWALDPDGSKGLLIPISISKNNRNEIIPDTIKRIDLSQFNSNEENQALECLLNGISKSRRKPTKNPAFPGLGLKQKGNRPAYPGGGIETQISASAKIQNCKIKTGDSLYKLGQLDRIPQRNWLQDSLKNSPVNGNQLNGFIIYGLAQEWPEGIQYKLSYLLEIIKKQLPEPLNLGVDLDITDIEPEEFLWKLLGAGLNCDTNENAVRKRLEQSDDSHILIATLTPEQIKNQEFLVNLLSVWLKLKLQPGSPNHFLLLICKSDQIEKTKPGLLSFTKWLRKNPPAWREKIENLLKAQN